MARALYVITRAQRRGAEVDATLLAEALAPEYEPETATVYGGGDPAVLGGRVPVHQSPASGGVVRRLSGIDPVAVRHLRTVIASTAPDLVVAYGGEPLLHAVRAARKAMTPVLYVKISMATAKAKRGARAAVVRRAIARCAAVAAVAPHLKRELRQDFGVTGEIHVTPTFRTASDIPPARHRDAVRAELGIPEDALLATFVGNLSWEKGPDLALEAMAKARKRVHLLLVGDGPLQARLEERAARRDLAGRVHLLGTRGDVSRLLAGSDVVLVTSREEGRPGMVLEAALGALPVVAFAVGGIPDLIEHRVEGLLIPPEDPESAGIALNELLDDPGLRSALGRGASKRAEGYLPAAALPAWRAAFEDALGGNTPPA